MLPYLYRLKVQKQDLIPLKRDFLLKADNNRVTSGLPKSDPKVTFNVCTTNNEIRFYLVLLPTIFLSCGEILLHISLSNIGYFVIRSLSK